MKLFRLALALGLIAAPALPQRHKLSYINTATEEGKLLQDIGSIEDPARKIAAMEDFIAKYPKHDGAAWVLGQLQSAQLTAGQFDKAIATGDKLLATDDADLDAAYNNLKAAEGLKDTAQTVQWAKTTSALARKTAATPKASEESEEDHKNAVESAQKTRLYAEYALSAAALRETDAARAMAAVDALYAENPKSQYLEPALPKYVYAARQANNTQAAVSLGEKAAAEGIVNEDLLLLMSDYYMNQKRDPAKVVAYTTRLADYMNTRPKPEGVSDADWQKKKSTTLGLAYWMLGTTYAADSTKQAETDKALRAALPYIQGNEQLMGPALFYLGLTNYQMAKAAKGGPRMADAVKYMQQSASIKGPFQAKAQSNVAVMKKETVAK